MRCLLSFFSVVALTAPGFSQTVDDRGAEALTQDLSRYVGQEAFAKGVVQVTAEGDAYRVTLDLTEITDLAPEQDVVEFSFAPYSFLTRPRGDGSWDVSMSGPISGSWEIKMPEGRQNVEMETTGLDWNGVYDPALAAFTTASGSMAGMTMSSRDPQQEMQASTGRSTFEMAAVEAAGGGVDFDFSQDIADFVETLNFTDPDTGQAFAVRMTAPSIVLDGNARGLRSRALLDLLAFGVANADEAKLAENQAELKPLLLAAVPLWERAEATYRVNDLLVETPMGAFGAAEAEFGGGIDGIRQDGTIDYGISLADLQVPGHLLPPWSGPLLPTHVNLNLGGVGIDLEDAARTAIEALDLSQDPPIPAEVGQQIAADFMADLPHVVISRSTVRNQDTEIAFEGEVRFVGPTPESNLTVDVTGFDSIVNTLNAASESDPQAAQYAAMALGIKGFGEARPDGSIRWVVNQKADGSVVVNGVMVKPADN